MKLRYFKYNFYRQVILYCIVALSLLFLYDAIYALQSTVELVLAVTVGLITVICIVYQYLSYITIDDNGIKHSTMIREYTLHWDSIGQVKVIPRRNYRSIWVVALKSPDKKDIYKRKNIFNRYNECITFPYNEKALESIIKHRGKEDLYDNKLFNIPIYNKFR